jgi:UDP-3-O-[3-hydroxymyristoyl] glucosamine N-acyltransferase
MQKNMLKLCELALLTDSKLVGNGEHAITNVETLELATATDASFLASPRYEKAMNSSRAGVIFVKPNTVLPAERNFLITEDPSLAFQKTVEAFHGTTQSFTGFVGIHPTAVIHPTAIIGKNVQIGPHTVIDRGAFVGNDTTLGAGCYIGTETVLGDDCLLHSHVTIRENCTIGDRVIIQAGAVIGSCGFGYVMDKNGHHKKLKQLGNVKIGDDVEIGANTTIDRARFKTTEIQRGTKIDNLVQIGHGVVIGEDNIIIAQTGIAGSSSTGKHVILAGQVAVAGHLHISDNIIVAGRGAVTKSLKNSGKYGGIPAVPLNEYNRNSVHLRNISTYIDKIKSLELRCKELEKAIAS